MLQLQSLPSTLSDDYSQSSGDVLSQDALSFQRDPHDVHGLRHLRKRSRSAESGEDSLTRLNHLQNMQFDARKRDAELQAQRSREGLQHVRLQLCGQGHHPKSPTLKHICRVIRVYIVVTLNPSSDAGFIIYSYHTSSYFCSFTSALSNPYFPPFPPRPGPGDSFYGSHWREVFDWRRGGDRRFTLPRAEGLVPHSRLGESYRTGRALSLSGLRRSHLFAGAAK